MEVVTLVGGFRGVGLGDLTNAQATALVAWLQQNLADADSLIARVRAATAAGQIAVASGQVLEQFYEGLNTRAIDLTNQISTLTVDPTSWRAQARQLVSDAATFADQAHLALGDVQARGLKLTLLALGSVALVGGAAWVVYRYGRRKHPQRRR